MTFSETIDALIPIYEEGMKAESYEALDEMGLDEGICWAAKHRVGFRLNENQTFLNYSPDQTSAYFFPYARPNKPIGVLIKTCIRPRLELLKRIQKDLKEKKTS